jgi:hypothetical protein
VEKKKAAGIRTEVGEWNGKTVSRNLSDEIDLAWRCSCYSRWLGKGLMPRTKVLFEHDLPVCGAGRCSRVYCGKTMATNLASLQVV